MGTIDLRRRQEYDVGRLEKKGFRDGGRGWVESPKTLMLLFLATAAWGVSCFLVGVTVLNEGEKTGMKELQMES